ncbi:MAG: CesT family type III secretion system chaperone [Simkaniaceae bacterium]|nr:CesT family type III secretion system chaperone [Simkaniaceae bacterium]
MNRINEVIFDLSERLDAPLHVDDNGACQLIFDEEMSITLEMDDSEQLLYLVSPVCDLPPGKFRARVLFEALRANSEIPPLGHFSYLAKIGRLVLCDTLEGEWQEGDKCLARVVALYEKAALWKKAIDAGQMAPQEALQRGSGAPSSMFGIQK